MLWSLFVIPVAIVGAASAILGAVNGGTILVIGTIADQWQRRRGYKAEEGVCTDREGGHMFGLKISHDGTDLGRFLAAMVDAFPDLFEEFKNKSYDLTVSEGKFLRKMVQVANSQLSEYLATVQQDPDDFEHESNLEFREDQLRLALAPVVMYLQSIPAARVKEN